ncbi:hypothetical protein [Thermicanus aegyptius]|nr:hypothetical protein [Thermicanus aegyptius]
MRLGSSCIHSGAPRFPSSVFWNVAAVVDDKPFGGVGLEVKEEA